MSLGIPQQLIAFPVFFPLKGKSEWNKLYWTNTQQVPSVNPISMCEIGWIESNVSTNRAVLDRILQTKDSFD